MFENLFPSKAACTRHRVGPLAAERERGICSIVLSKAVRMRPCA